MLKEIVLNIKEGTFTSNHDGYKKEYDGYIVETSNREILAGIDNIQNCCENWGYITSHDDLTVFTGSELLDIRITDSLLNTVELPDGVYKDSAIFITFVTTNGDFQLVVYNEHEGYYAHEVLVQSNQLNYSEYL